MDNSSILTREFRGPSSAVMKIKRNDINTNKGILSTFSRSRSNMPAAMGDSQGVVEDSMGSEFVYLNALIPSAANNYGKGGEIVVTTNRNNRVLWQVIHMMEVDFLIRSKDCAFRYKEVKKIITFLTDLAKVTARFSIYSLCVCMVTVLTSPSLISHHLFPYVHRLTVQRARS